MHHKCYYIVLHTIQVRRNILDTLFVKEIICADACAIETASFLNQLISRMNAILLINYFRRCGEEVKRVTKIIEYGSWLRPRRLLTRSKADRSCTWNHPESRQRTGVDNDLTITSFSINRWSQGITVVSYYNNKGFLLRI